MSIMNLCAAWKISVFRSYENDIFPCNNKSILMSILLLFGINVCMESNKINLKLLNLGQISKKWLLSSNGPLQFGQLVLSDKKSLNKCAFRLLASFLNWQMNYIKLPYSKIILSIGVSLCIHIWSVEEHMSN